MKTRLSSLILLCVALLLFGACAQQVQQSSQNAGAVIYEVNIRQHTPEGTFNAFAEHLPRLKDLGVDILWIMPLYPIGELERKGSLGSYYAIKDYKAVNPEFGTMDDFKSMVAKAHELGLKVIIDWVPNHTSPDAVWTVNKDKGWYVLDSLGNFVVDYDWTDIAKLDYKNVDMRRAMTDAMLFWLQETEIDGFRCDVAANVPVDFWEATVKELKAVNPDVFMLAEAEEPALQQNAFDMYYAWHLHAMMNKIAQGKANADSLRYVLNRMDQRFPSTTIPMMFTSNHDENSWNGTEFERMGAAVRAMAALTYLLPGMPLIYNGQEAGFNRRLEFFEKDQIDWTDSLGYTPFYQELNSLREANPALHSQPAGGKLEEISNSALQDVVAFQRTAEGNTVVAVFNLSNRAQQVDFPGATHPELKETMALSPWEYKLFVK